MKSILVSLVLVGCLSGCATSSDYYKRDFGPELHLRNVSLASPVGRMWFYISNPWDVPIKRRIACRQMHDTSEKNVVYSRFYTVEPMSDAIASVSVVPLVNTQFSCRLTDR